MPKGIQDRGDNKILIDDEELRKMIVEEFSDAEYLKKEEIINKEWLNVQAEFVKKLKTLGRPIQEKYFIYLTKYGVGGSYGYPDNMIVNIGNRFPVRTICHEMIHLTIQDLIEEYEIEHWVKERIVDLVMVKFFPEVKKIQNEGELENEKEINEIFEKHFPDIEKVIIEISKI